MNHPPALWTLCGEETFQRTLTARCCIAAARTSKGNAPTPRRRTLLRGPSPQVNREQDHGSPRNAHVEARSGPKHRWRQRTGGVGRQENERERGHGVGQSPCPTKFNERTAESASQRLPFSRGTCDGSGTVTRRSGANLTWSESPVALTIKNFVAPERKWRSYSLISTPRGTR